MMVTDINLQKTCSKSNWCSWKYKLGSFDSLTEHNLIKIIFAFTHVREQTLKNLKGNIYLCLHTRRMGRGVLKIWHVFADSTNLNDRSIVHFGGWRKWKGHLLIIFWWHNKWVTSKTIKIYIYKKKTNQQTNVWNQNKSDIPKISI